MSDDARACPRCAAATVAVQHVAPGDDGGALWQVLHCAGCSFTWRTGEPPETLDPRRRPDAFQLDAARIARLPDQLPRDHADG